MGFSAGAEERPVDVKPRVSGALSNAAAAASAAADAATAAAAAAKAAAAAATSAVEAINVVLPPSQRPAGAVKPVAPLPPNGGSIAGPTPPEADKSLVIRVPDVPEKSTGRFLVPSEQTLAALVGMVEIPVSVSEFSDFGNRIHGEQSIGSEPVNSDLETTLDEAIGAGRRFSREVLAADERTSQARAQSGQALANLLPSLTVRKNSGKETSSPSVATDSSGNVIQKETHHRTDSVWTLKQPLVDMPGFFDYRRRGVIELARDENRRAADGEAYLASVNAYLSLIATRLQADMAADFERQLNELLAYIDKRASAGASSMADLARVRARSQAAVSSRLEQESAHTAAGVEFVRLTNLAPKIARVPDLEDLGGRILPTSVDQAIEVAMDRNPDITALVSEAYAAEIDKSAARSRYLPRLDLELTDTKSVHPQGDPSSDGQRDKRVMLVLNWSLFNGGGDYQYGKERAARHLELKYKLDDQRRRVVQSLSAQYATLQAVRERLSSGYKELGAISSAAEAMSTRMLSGNQSLLDLLDTYERHYQARVRLVNLHIQEMNSVAQIVRLVQGAPAPSVSGKRGDELALIRSGAGGTRSLQAASTGTDKLIVAPELLYPVASKQED
jgi:outer membrane protein TolC